MIIRLMVYALLIFLTSIIGGILPLYVREARKKDLILKRFVSLGAGMLLGMAILHMLPEASRQLPESYAAWFLLGFVILLVLERFIMVHACEEDSCHYHTIGITAFVGLTVHGFIEGLALGSSMYVASLAPLVFVAIISHKIPSSFSLTSILAMSQSLKRTQIIWFLIGVSISIPFGMFVAYFLLVQQTNAATAILIAVSAGTFLYIATCDLLPELHKEDSNRMAKLYYFFVGLLLSYFSGLLVHH